ncbi:MAG: MopE-related protein [Saprospiraceae bacterium]
MKYSVIILFYIILIPNLLFSADVSFTTMTVSGGNHYQGTLNIVTYMIRMDVSGAPVTMTNLSMATSGTYDADDISLFRLHRHTSPSLTGTTLITSDGTATGTGETVSFPLNQIFNPGTYYLLVTFTLTNNATDGNSIHMDGGTHAATYSFVTAPNVTDTQSDLAEIQWIGFLWYEDLDNDSYGNPINFIYSSPQPSGYVSNPDDCEDTNANVRPGATEVCDGMDNNCNGLIAESPDLDSDGVCDDDDNCPDSFNPGQEDLDNNGVGDLCESYSDLDGDGISDDDDNCLDSPNPDQSDSDCDEVGDSCDICPGIDDKIDCDQNGIPDCNSLPPFSQVFAGWICSHNKVLICKIPLGNPSNKQTLCVNYNAAQTHLNQGTYLGLCNSASCNGNKIYNNKFIETYIPGAEIELLIFPSPSMNWLHFNISNTDEKEIKVEIINSIGQIFLVRHLNDGNKVGSFDISELQNGIYFMRVSTVLKIKAIKFIKI